MKHAAFIVLLAACNGGDAKQAPEPASKVEKEEPKQASSVTMTKEAIAAARITTEVVAESDVVSGDELPGTIEAQNGALVVVNTRAAGVVESITVDIGDKVKAGQQVATVRSLDLAEAQAAYRKATVSNTFASASLERSQGLKQDGVISQRRLDADQQQSREAKLSIDEAERRVRILGGSVSDASGMISITTPIAGTVALRKANRGESVAENSPLFTVVDATRIVVQLRALGGTPVVVGAEVEFTVDAIPDRTFKAKVQSSSDLLDPETRRFFIRCSVDNPDGILKPGMFVTGRVFRPGVRALTVAEAAVQIIDGKPIVFVEKAPGQFEPRNIKVGTKAGGRVPVQSGLVAGEKVVAAGSFMVRTELQKSELEE